MALSSWTRAGPVGRRVYTRPLGLNELGFYYDSHINGTADTLTHTVIQVSAEGKHCLALDNLGRAWRALKNRFPLLGAMVQIKQELPQFLVAEERLESIVPGEISVSSVSSLEEAQEAATTAINGQRKLSDDLLSRIEVLSRTDDASTYHVLIDVAHLITDGVGNGSLLKEFLNMLSFPDGDAAQADLEARLSLAVAAESLVPASKMSIARQRWRRAAGHIISKLQDAKRTGGHTLPKNFAPVATRLPAQSGVLNIQFSPKASALIIKNLRRLKLTVGNALPVLAQVGLARLLCRRYVRGEISPEEWEFRKKQPSHTAGPINLRGFLDKAWYQAGGHSNVSVNVGYFYYTLGFTSLGSANLAPGDPIPELSDLMSPQRFILRCNTLKKLANRYLAHPLFFEVGAARLAGKIANQKIVAAKWEKDPSSIVRESRVVDNNVPVIEQEKYGPVMSHGWSTFGNMGGSLPREYPSHNKAGPSNPPLLRLQSHQGLLHCRTGELYLGMGISSEQLVLILHFDKNVFTNEVVEEWVDETKQAMLWYLGNTETAVSKM
ncbi:hypothetical protein B0H19DRAFT_1166714 [Mycena capillaripes]|nr:hypothetical protein B0H19DRAFT_1166714 [Mycena capillaripes]